MRQPVFSALGFLNRQPQSVPLPVVYKLLPQQPAQQEAHVLPHRRRQHSDIPFARGFSQSFASPCSSKRSKVMRPSFPVRKSVRTTTAAWSRSTTPPLRRQPLFLPISSSIQR